LTKLAYLKKQNAQNAFLLYIHKPIFKPMIICNQRHDFGMQNDVIR